MKTSFLLLSLLFALTLKSPGAAISWTNTSGGLWSAAANWSPNSAPAPGDSVFITAAGSYTVTQDVHVAVASLTLGGASGSGVAWWAHVGGFLFGLATVFIFAQRRAVYS